MTWEKYWPVAKHYRSITALSFVFHAKQCSFPFVLSPIFVRPFYSKVAYSRVGMTVL